MKKAIKIVLIGIVVLAIIWCVVNLLLILILFSGDYDINWTPTEGTWYCEELQMQLIFGKSGGTLVVMDGRKTTYSWNNDIGSKWISITTESDPDSGLPFGSIVFSAEVIELTETEFTVREEDTDTIYIFKRIEQPFIIR